MDNDQIKSQIENAKRAFVASKERGNEASLVDPEMDDQQLREDIMARLRGLMDEAAQSKIGSASDPVVTEHSPRENRAKPFWAQNKVDIPPSEQFGKRQKMQEQNNPTGDNPLDKTAQPTPTEPQLGPDPLTAIRQEVFNKLGDGAGS